MQARPIVRFIGAIAHQQAMLIVEVISTFRRTLQGALDKADIVR